MARQSKVTVDEEIRIRPMTVTRKPESVIELFGEYRAGSWYVPGTAVLAAIITVVGLVSVLPASTLTSWTITGDASPIAEAGGLAQPVVGFLQFGTVRMYIPFVSVLFVVGGELAAFWLGRFRMLTAIVAGATAGIQPVVVSGCGCGYGTAGTAMSLLEQATAVGLL